MAVAPIASQPTVADLGRRVKAKYPAYAKYSDEELGRKVKAKYPAYSRYVDAAAPSDAPAAAAPMAGVVGGASTSPRRAIAETRAPINPYSRTEQPASAPNPIVRGFTGTIYGGNVAGAGRTVKAAGQATGIPAIERAGQAMQAHGERFKGAPPPPDIFQIAPDDPAARQKVLDFLGYTLGSGMASSAPSVAGAAVGAAAGGIPGAIAGAAVPAYLMNTGSVVEEIEKISGGTPQGRARLALLIGIPVSALDVISPVDFGAKITKALLRQSVAEAARGGGLWAAVKAGAKGVLPGAIKEGGTEGIQDVVQDVGVAAGTEKRFDVGETARGAATSTIGGALTGGVLGFGTSVLPQGRPPAPAEEAQILRVRPPKVAPSPTPAATAIPARPTAPVRAATPAPTAQIPQAPKAAPGAPTEIQARIAALETQVRKRPNEPKLRRRLDALKAEHQAKVGPEDEAHEALQAKIAGAPRRISELEKQIAETPNDKRAAKWKARVEELKALVATGRPKAKGAAGEAGAEPAPAKQTTAPEPAASSPSKAPSKAAKAPSIGAVDTQRAPAALPASPAAGKSSGSETAAPTPAPKKGAATVPTAGPKDRPAAPQPTPAPAEAPARTMVPNMQFGDEAAAKRVAVGIARNTPEAAPKVVKTKKGFEIEVNENVGASRLKKQSFVKVAPKNPAPDVAAAAASPVVEKPAQPAGKIVYHNGDAAEIIGPKQIIHGGEFYPARVLEGHRKGKEIAVAARHVDGEPSKKPPDKKPVTPQVPARSAPQPAPEPRRPKGNSPERGGTGAAVSSDPTRSPRDAALDALGEVRDRKPRPIRKMFGAAASNPENIAKYAELMRAWNKEHRAAKKLFDAADANEELARQGKPLKEAEAQANARSADDSPAGPGLVFHETSVERALGMLPFSPFQTDLTMEVRWLSSHPDLATGQGKNKGVMIEFDRSGLKMAPSLTKPAAGFVEAQGMVEYEARLNGQASYQKAVRAVTVKPDAASSARDRGDMKRLLADLEERAGWTRSTLPDGSVRLTAPGHAAPSPPVAAAPEVPREAPSGARNYKIGERLIVPYTGRSKKQTSEVGVFRNYVDVGGVPHVEVVVHHGKSVESHRFPESKVRRRPKIDRRPAAGRNPGMATKFRDEAGGDVGKAREMVERAQAAFDRDEEAAQAAYPQAGQEPNPEYPKLRARMRKARDVLAVAKGVARELDPDFGFPSFLKLVEGEDVSFNVDEIEKLPPWLGEEGFVNLADLRDAIRMAMRRISGIARRDPKLKRAMAKRPLRRSPEVELIIEALKQAGPVREAQSAEDTAERKRRIALSKTLEEGKEGFERIHARKASQKGELPPVHFESIAKALSYEQLKKLGNQIVNHPALSFYEVIQAGDALEKLLGERGGRIPEPAELELLELIFGPEFVDAIMKKRPQIMDWKRRGWLAIAVSRALRSSFDFGAALRQGLYLGSRFPKLWAKAFAAQHFHWWSKTAFEEDMEDIANDPLYIYARMGHLRSLRDERGAEKDDPLYKRENALSITRVGGRNLAQQEEAFLDAEFAEQMHEPIERAIPGMGGKVAAFPVRIVSSAVRRSNQAYVGFLNRLRFGAFKELWRLARANGRDPATDVKLLKEICRYINASSGRGDSKFIDDHMQGMNAAFFSARLQKSRIELLNPRNYVKGDPFVRKQYWLQMRNASAGATVLLTLAAWMGAKVEWDSLNADWGKIRVGGVVYDVLGGLTQYLRLYPAIASAIWQQANGRRLKINGRPVTALALISRFVSHKLAPVPAVVYTWLEGYANSTEKKGGGRKKLHYSDIPKDLLFLFVPMLLEDFFEVWNSDPRWQVRAASIPASTYGVSVQSYDLQQQRLRIRAPQMPRMPSAPSMP